MDPNLQPLHDQFSAQVSAAQTNLAFVDAASATLIQAQADRNAALKARDDAQNANSELVTEVSQLQAQLNALNAVKVFDGLELTPWLVAGGTAANSVGGAGTAGQQQSIPGVNCAYLEIDPNDPYADKYFYKPLGPNPTATKFTFEASFLFADAANAANSQALEMDVRRDNNNVICNPACQMDFAEGQLRIWNRVQSLANKSLPADQQKSPWISIGVPCPRFTPGQWVKVILKAHTDGTTLFYDSLQVGTDVHDISAFTFPLTNETQANKQNCALQLDGDKAVLPYRVYVYGVRFTAA